MRSRPSSTQVPTAQKSVADRPSVLPTSPRAQTVPAMGANDFNFDIPDGERYTPSPARARAWQRLLPATNFAFAPVVTDRAAWSRWQNDPLGQRLLTRARELAAMPFPDYNDATYVDCLETKSVTKINQVIPLTRERQVTFLLAEAIYDEGEFLDVLESDFNQLVQVSSWVHPNNDLERRNLEGKTIEIDLVVAHFGAQLSYIAYLLGPRISPAFQARLKAEVLRRVFNPLRQRLESGRDVYWWIDVTHNWNSVNLACLTQAAAAILPADQRAWWFAAGEMLVKNFRESFNSDGFCTEGVGYWGYGVSHYIIISELFRLGTDGLYDLFDEPKMSRVALFPDRAEIQPGVFPTFADCRIDTQPLFWARHWLQNRRGADPAESEVIPDAPDPFGDANIQMAGAPMLWMFQTINPRQPRATVRPPELRHWFKNSSLLIARPAPTTRRQLSATLLGGNNGVNHNHNDLGTFTIVVDGRALIVDPGLEIYSFRTFSAQRYESQLLNSYGHPVPRVAGQLQEVGAEWQTNTILTEFTDETDRVVFDLRRAYDVPTLRLLEREFIFDRRGDGSVTIIDRVEFSEPADFESALISFGECEVNGNHLTFNDHGIKLHAKIQIEGARLALATDTINQPPHPIRVALQCAQPVTAATITTVFTA